jgi:hypothetical protein
MKLQVVELVNQVLKPQERWLGVIAEHAIETWQGKMT